MNYWRTTIAAIAALTALMGVAHAAPADANILIDRAENNRNLTVRFSGANVSLVELRVNGVSVATRSVSSRDQSGETNFALDVAALEDGENEVEVRCFDESGKLVGTEKLVIHVDREATGPVYLTRPRTGSTVQGPVEISVGFKQNLRNVYVSFFVNDEFKSLRNVPPFTYLWDTSRVSNGWHEVQAWVVDDTNRTFKTQKLRVFVNNPGGRTDRVNVVDLTTTANTVRAATGAAASLRSVQAAGDAVVQGTTTLPAIVYDLSAAVRNVALGATAGTRPSLLGAGIPTGERTIPPARAAEAPVAVLTADTVQVDQAAVAQVAQTAQVSTAPVAQVVPTVIAYGTRLPNLGNLTVVFNNSVVPFDVLPRVLNGVPLTPFRHLFEHAGGTVQWQHSDKTVTAEGLNRVIFMRIGDPFAKVNDREMQMELAPFIDRGRTVVPLSFIRESLNVDVEVDAKTGHVLITSRSN